MCNKVIGYDCVFKTLLLVVSAFLKQLVVKNVFLLKFNITTVKLNVRLYLDVTEISKFRQK